MESNFLSGDQISSDKLMAITGIISVKFDPHIDQKKKLNELFDIGINASKNLFPKRISWAVRNANQFGQSPHHNAPCKDFKNHIMPNSILKYFIFNFSIFASDFHFWK